jgi:integrase
VLFEPFRGETQQRRNTAGAARPRAFKRSRCWCIRSVAPASSAPAAPARSGELVERCKTDRGEVAFYDFAEYHRLVEAAGLLDPRIELLVLLGGDAGLRRGEAIALEWTDVDLRRPTLHVQRSEWHGQVTVPKGGRSRRLRLTERLAAALQAHRHLKGPRVLYADDGATPTNKVIRRWMEKAQRRTVLPANGGFHILRHTFCSHLAMQGATPKAIQELAGHQDLTTTQRYMHLSPAHKDAAIRLLDQRPVGDADFGDLKETTPPGQKKPSGVE